MLKSKIVREWASTILTSIILFLLIHTYVAEANYIPSVSMVPTLQVNDRLLIEKITPKIMGINRGDIIVFQPPSQVGIKDHLIKRVIALPGETIMIRKGLVYINDKVLTEPYISQLAIMDFGPYKVRENNLFVMGDNRNNSYDSRFWGTVPIDHVIGKPIVRYYPLNHLTLFDSNPYKH